MAGSRVVELRAGVREPQVGDRLAFDGVGWVPEVDIARPRGVTHVHTDTIVRVAMGPWRSPDFVTGVSGWQIDADGSAEFNDITARGTIVATAGEIGGWTIEAGHLYAGSGAARVGLKPGTYPFYAGAEAEASAPFRVNTAGEMWATNAHITGEIDANSGHLGTLDIDGVLTVGTGAPVIQIDGPSKRIRTSDFVSGQQGWEITHEGNAEFNNLFVRGELHSTVFVADEMHATGGTLAVMTAAKVAEPISVNDNKLPAIGGQVLLIVQASWDTGLCYIADNDVLRIKTMAEVAVGGGLDLWDIWLEVALGPVFNDDRDLANGKPGTYTLRAYRRQGGETDLVIPTGAAAVVWGHIGSEEGGIILTSDMNYSPYMDIFTIPSATPWSSGTTPHVRVGNLDGVLGLGEEWGIAAGEDLSDAGKGHVVLSDQRVRLWGVAQRWWDTSGNIRGQIDPSAGDSDVLFWLGPSEAGAQFKVLGDGSVWASSVALSESLGQWIFSKADGLLLLGPHCEINDSGWWSLRRQKATVSGAFHQEAGRWLGTRGLVIEGATTNLCANPSLETNTTGWSLRGSATISQSGDQARYGSYSLKTVCTAGAYDGSAYEADIAISASTEYTVSFWIYTVTAGVSMNLRVVTDAGGSHDGNFTSEVGWQRITQTFTSDASDTKITSTRIYKLNDATVLTFYVDGLQVEAQICATSYCDGSLGHEYTWDGTAHDGTSQRAVTQVNLDAHAVLLKNNPSWTVGGWFQMGYDYDAGWPTAGANYLFEVWEDDNNRAFMYFDSTANTLKARYTEGGVSVTVSEALAFSAGDWVHLVLIVNTAGNLKFYVNGTLADSEDLSARGNIQPTQMNLGARNTAAQTAGATYSELAMFDDFASAAEIAAMYALQRPLVDMGALDRPGIYILDGRFRMASSLTGNRIEMNAEEIAGYDSAGTKQFYLRASDGAAMCGGGHVILDAAGMRMVGTGLVDNTRRVLFQDDTSGDRTLGWVGAGWAGGGSDLGVTWLAATRDSGDPWPANIQIVLAAVDTVAGTDVRLSIGSGQVVDFTGEKIVRTEALLRPGTGTSDPTSLVEDGCLFYRTDTDKLRLRANGAWVNLN